MDTGKLVKIIAIWCFMSFCMVSCNDHGLCDIAGIRMVSAGMRNEKGYYVPIEDHPIPADKVLLHVGIEWVLEKDSYSGIDFLKSPIKDYSVWVDLPTGESEDMTSKVEPHGAPDFPITQWWPDSYLEFRFTETPPIGVYRFRVQLNVDDGRQFTAETDDIEIVAVSEQ